MPWAGEGYEKAEPRRRSRELWIGVLPRNVGVVEVFQRCQPQIGIGMGVVWQGVGATEVRAACLMSRVPRADWPRYLDGVQGMARVVAQVRNEEEATRARRANKERKEK